MKATIVLRGSACLLALWALTQVGCAAMQAQQTEELLSAAGFRMQLADTPEKLAHLKALTQYKLVPHDRDGKIHYVFADAKRERLYTGDEESYQQFQKIALQKRIADEQVMAAEENQDASMNWGMWY